MAKVGVAKGKRHDDVVAVVKAMRGARSDGVEMESVWFWNEVAENLKPGGSLSEKSATVAVTDLITPVAPSTPPGTTADATPAIVNPNHAEDDELKAAGRVLKKRIAAQDAIAADQGKTAEQQKAATKAKDRLQLTLNANLAAQEVIAKQQEKAAAYAHAKAAPADASLKSNAALKAVELDNAKYKKADADRAESDAPTRDEKLKITVEAAVQAAFKAKDEAKANFKNYQACFHVGANLLNPYKIVPTTEKEDVRKKIGPSSETEVGGFLEFVYTNRWAWNEERVTRPLFQNQKYGTYANLPSFLADQSEENKGRIRDFYSRNESNRSIFSGKTDRWALLSEVDVQLRFGYNFSSGSELSANTLAGSSDINAELDLAVPFFAGDFVTDAYTVGPELSYAATTEKKALDVHHRLFAGIGYSTAFESPYEADAKRRILLHTRLGYAQASNVRFLDNKTREIFTVNDGTARYFGENGLAFETEILFPVRTYSFLTLSARIYGVPKTGPNPWNLSIGFTTPLSSLLDGILPK